MPRWFAGKNPLSSPPPYSDIETTEFAKSIHTMIWLLVTIGSVYCVAMCIYYPSNTIRWLYVEFSVVVIAGLGFWLNSRKYAWAVFLLMTSLIWALLYVLAFTSGGVRSTATSGYLVVVLAAGLLMGGRTALIMAVICWLTELSFVYLAKHNLLPAPQVSYGELRLWMIHGVYYALVMFFPYLTTRSIRRSLQRAKVEIGYREQTEKALRESEERFRYLSAATFEGVMLHDSGMILDANEAFAKLFGFESPDELIGKVGWEILPFTEESLAFLKKFSATGSTEPVEITVVRKDGSIMEAETRGGAALYMGRKVKVVTMRDISERKQAEEEIRKSRELLNSILETSRDGIVVEDEYGAITFVNNAFVRVLRYERADELIGRPLTAVLAAEDNERILGYTRQRLGGGDAPTIYEFKGRCKDSTLIDLEVSVALTEFGGKKHILSVVRDIRDRKKEEFERQQLEQQIRQSQKLDSIGQLAGGVAHDYNNILGVVIGYADFLKSQLNDGDKPMGPVNAILAAANRGADLTRQLLAFARKEMISPKVINMNSLVESIEKMLRRIIGENLRLIFAPGEDIWNIQIDPSQFDQVLINLAANSRDAIEGTGTITIKTANVSLRENEVGEHLGISAGDYVRLTFQDTGAGMDGETMKRIFEPFFTTKPKGQGTGLGLATVYGIVKQNNGDISVVSKPGEGTTFEIYLPRSYKEAEVEKGQPSEESIRGSEAILIVEDQADMLEIAKTSLEKYGYKVMTALGPAEGLLVSEAYAGKIHLLLTDVIMPNMNGKELSEKMAVLKRGIRTLFMSGYTANELAPQGILKEHVHFIQKPFTPSELARKVRESLDAKIGGE